MRIFRHSDNIPDNCRGSVIALGNFDGFHRGHQIVIAEAGRIAREMNTTLSVMTVEPHPRSFFNPAQEDFRLTSFRTKAHLLEAFGVDQLFTLPFDRDLYKMSAQDFVLKILLEDIGVLHVVTGFDYRFGAGRGGGTDVLGWLSEMEQFGLTIVEKVMEGDHIYSSTNIRESLRQGRVREVADRLGHWWCVEGHVIQGDQRGRTIGFPTANISMDGYLKPLAGVYAVRVQVADGEVWQGVANVGRRPTFNKKDVLLEVHLFDFEDHIYDHPVKVAFVDFIREETKFDGLDALKAQIALDCTTARELLAKPENRQDFIPMPRLEDYL